MATVAFHWLPGLSIEHGSHGAHVSLVTHTLQQTAVRGTVPAYSTSTTATTLHTVSAGHVIG